MKIYGFTWIFFILVGLFLLWLAQGGPQDAQLSPPPKPFLQSPINLEPYDPDKPVEPLLRYDEPVHYEDQYFIPGVEN